MFSRTILVAFVAFSAVFAQAASLTARQAGNAECNLDRLEIVVKLADAQRTTRTLTTQLASDPVNSKGIKAVSDGLDHAQDAIDIIADALVAGQNAPADARQHVSDGLDEASDGLDSIHSNDTAVTENLNKLHDQLVAAATAGNGVLENCK